MNTLHAASAVALGAALGGLLRWISGLRLNHLVPGIPMGTLMVNLAGGYLVGIAVALFALRPDIAPEWRLFVITGFLGGLTTFSSFSAEVVQLVQAQRPGAAVLTIALHVCGSLATTWLGLCTVSAAKGV